MNFSLPVHGKKTRQLVRVVPQILASLSAEPSWFPAATGAVMVVVDGLGVINLRDRVAHARFLSGSLTAKSQARTVFPSTTATALTSVFTAAPPAEHGITSYSVRVPRTGKVANQLRDWDVLSAEPLEWQRKRLVWEGLGSRPGFVVSKSSYRASGFTEATLKGAEFRSGESVGERVSLTLDLMRENPDALIYLYIPELDQIGHKHGWESNEWLEGLEKVDGAIRDLSVGLASGTGLLVTADHGMVDVPSRNHVLLNEDSDLLKGVEIIAGEPRMLNLHVLPGEHSKVLERWRSLEGQRSWVMSREEAISLGLFGGVPDEEIAARIGDVLVAARSDIAYYDNRLSDKGAQKMIGQHGSLTSRETMVPLLQFGAFA